MAWRKCHLAKVQRFGPLVHLQLLLCNGLHSRPEFSLASLEVVGEMVAVAPTSSSTVC